MNSYYKLYALLIALIFSPTMGVAQDNTAPFMGVGQELEHFEMGVGTVLPQGGNAFSISGAIGIAGVRSTEMYDDFSSRLVFSTTLYATSGSRFESDEDRSTELFLMGSLEYYFGDGNIEGGSYRALRPQASFGPAVLFSPSVPSPLRPGIAMSFRVTDSSGRFGLSTRLAHTTEYAIVTVGGSFLIRQ